MSMLCFMCHYGRIDPEWSLWDICRDVRAIEEVTA